VIIALLGIFYFHFFMNLPKRIRLLFLASAGLCICGGIGFEMVSGHYIERHDDQQPIYIMMTTIEELLEMLGLSLFVYALLEYIKQSTPRVSFRIGSGEPVKTGDATIGDKRPPADTPTA
jgi:hypothetical protein